MSSDLSDRVCLVTGAAGEIGSAVSSAFAEAGARVVLLDADSARGKALEAELSDVHGEGVALSIAADITDGAAVAAYMSETKEAFGRLDAIVNCAGVEGEIVDAHEYSEAEFDRVMDINVKGTWLNFRHGVPLMLESGGGSIVNISSGAGLRALPGLSAYVASKHAVIGITRSCAVELATLGVRVNALAPGPVSSPMMDSLERGMSGLSAEQARELYLERVPMKRYGAAREIAQVAVFLASDDASYVTGAVISVDGGATAA